MKNKLRTRIKELANQIIVDEENFNTATMKEKVGRLYDRLTILEYLEAQIEKPSEKRVVVENNSLDSKSFREENWFTEPEQLPQSPHTEDLIEPLMEKIKDIVAQMPQEADRIEEMLEEVLPKETIEEKKPQRSINDIEVFAESYQKMPEFERKQPTLDFEIESKNETIENDLNETTAENFTKIAPNSAETSFVNQPDNSENLQTKIVNEPRTKSINDSAKQGLNVGLNDRMAFIKHLFGESAEDYARVLSQINTMGSYQEAQDFIKGQVKPDYNYWLNKDMYAERFMALVEKSFN